MKTMLKTLFVSAFLFTAMPLLAVLPEAVERACFTIEVNDTASQTHWSLTSWDIWRDVAGVQIQMNDDGSYVAMRAGHAHPTSRYTTSVKLFSPPVTSYTTHPLQTLTYTITAKEFVQNSTILVDVIKDANLPPFKIQLLEDHLVIEAKDKTWYVIIGDPKARIHQTKDNPYRVTVEVSPITIDKTTREGEIKLYVGEGPMPLALPDSISNL